MRLNFSLLLFLGLIPEEVFSNEIVTPAPTAANTPAPTSMPTPGPTSSPTEAPTALDPAGYICLQTTELSWQSSQDAANVNGANLVSIHCSEQNQRLTEFLNSSDRVWLGGSDSATEGNWLFTDGSSVSSYTNWGSGQPNDSYGSENCMELNYPLFGLWNDAPCTLIRKAIYYSPTPITGMTCMSYVPCISQTVSPTSSVTPALTAANTPAPTSMPTPGPCVSSASTHPTVSFGVFFSGSIFVGMSVEDLQSQFSSLQSYTKVAIVAVAALQEEGFEISECAITISSSIVSDSSRNLVSRDSRSLQGTSGIQQDVTFNAPSFTVNTGTIATNINNSITGLTATVSVVTSEYEEPPWPCNGVTCSNAGKCEVTSPTTALCKCENTFVPSESGLECICPDGLDFHSNVNRCLPPPTIAPSDLPSAFPSLTPSMVPSDGKIDKEETPTCFDDMTSTFKLFKKMEEVECTWLTKNEKKTNARKIKYCVIEEVKSLCQSTCGECTACNDNEGNFTLLNMKKRETCAWLTKNKGKAEKRKRRYCALNNVSNMCKLSCDVCAVEEDSGRV